MRSRGVLLLLLAAAACGGREDPRPAPAPIPGPAAAPQPPGEFHLLVEPRGKPGRRPPIRIAGRPEGVVLMVERFIDPVARRFAPDGGGVELTFTETLGANRPVLPPLPGGEYRVTARRDGREETADLVVSDLIVVIRHAGGDLLLFVVDAESGQPAAGAAVDAGGPDGRVRGKTDASGVFRTRARLGDRVYAVASQGERLGSAERVKLSAAPEGPVHCLVADRADYAPGEEVRFLGVYRVASRGRLACADLGDAVFAAFDSAGRAVGAGPVVAGPLGCYSGAFALDASAESGEGRLRVRVAGSAHEIPLRIRPANRVGPLLRLEPMYRGVVGEELTWSVGVSHPLPEWLRGARVRWEAFREDPRRSDGRAPAGSGESRLDGPDTVLVSFGADSPGRYHLEVEATDAGGNATRCEATAAVDPAAFEFLVVTDRNFYSPGAEAAVTVRPCSRPGERFPFSGTVSLGAERRAFDNMFRAAIPVPKSPGFHRVVAEATDAEGRAVRGDAEIFVLDGDDAVVDEVRLVPELSHYAPGEEAKALLLLPPRLHGASVLLTMEGRGLGPHAVEEATASSRMLTLRIPDDLGSRITLSAAVAHGGDVAGAWASISVPAVDRAMFEIAGPWGQDGALFGATIRILDGRGKPVVAAIALKLTPYPGEGLRGAAAARRLRGRP